MFCFCVWPRFLGAVLSVIKAYGLMSNESMETLTTVVQVYVVILKVFKSELPIERKLLPRKFLVGHVVTLHS